MWAGQYVRQTWGVTVTRSTECRGQLQAESAEDGRGEGVFFLIKGGMWEGKTVGTSRWSRDGNFPNNVV